MRLNTKKRNRKIIPITIGVIVLLLLGFSIFYAFNNNLFNGRFSDVTREPNSVNYDSPTDQEIDSSQDAKKNNSSTSSNPTIKEGEGSGKKQVNVGVSYADVYDGKVEIRAFTNSVIEGDGTCKVTLKHDSSVISKESEAFIDSTTSQCRPVYIPVSDFPEKGTWSVVVTYESLSSYGKSASSEFTL